MEFRDPVHGSIHITDAEIPIINNPVFQRLRRIKQLGLTEMVFPGGTHNRLLHSLGVMRVVEMVFNTLFPHAVTDRELTRLKETAKLAGLLHDIGHAPLGHTTEAVMPLVEELKIPAPFFFSGRQATHEDYTIKSIIDSPLTESFHKARADLGVNPIRVAELIAGTTQDSNYFTYQGVNYFPLMHQLISSEMDCDRMDYLLRDSYFCGVSYGAFDLDWIIDNLKICIMENRAYLGIGERAVSTFDDFLLCRYHMFLMVYFHYKSVCLEQILMRYFATAPDEYKIPADIESYLVHDDNYLLKALQQSENRYAKQIINNKIPAKIFENFGPPGFPILVKLEKYLKKNKIEYIRCSSKNRISKYYKGGENKALYPIKVVRKYHHHSTFVDIDKATDLFQKFSNTHFIDRIHCYMDELSEKKQQEIISIIDENDSGKIL